MRAFWPSMKKNIISSFPIFRSLPPLILAAFTSPPTLGYHLLTLFALFGNIKKTAVVFKWRRLISPEKGFNGLYIFIPFLTRIIHKIPLGEYFLANPPRSPFFKGGGRLPPFTKGGPGGILKEIQLT